jgi:hypothetical protein
MKKHLLLLVALGLIATLSAQKTYRITGKLANQGNEKITLSYIEDGQLVENTTQAVDGAFSLTGPAPEQPTVVRLQSGVDRNIYLGDTKTSMYLPGIPLELILSPGCSLQISGDAMDLNLLPVTGDAYNDAFSRFRASEATLIRQMREQQNLLSQAKKMGLTDELSTIGQKMLEIRQNVNAGRKQYIATHPDEFLSAWLLSVSLKEYTAAELQVVFQGLTESVRQSTYGKTVAEKLQNQPATPTK